MDNQSDPSSIFTRTDSYATEDSIYRMHVMGKTPQQISDELSVDIRLVQDFIKKHFN